MSLPDKVQDVNDRRQHLIDVRVGVEQSVNDDGIDRVADISIPAFEPQEDNLNIHCDAC